MSIVVENCGDGDFKTRNGDACNQAGIQFPQELVVLIDQRVLFDELLVCIDDPVFCNAMNRVVLEFDSPITALRRVRQNFGNKIGSGKQYLIGRNLRRLVLTIEQHVRFVVVACQMHERFFDQNFAKLMFHHMPLEHHK